MRQRRVFLLDMEELFSANRKVLDYKLLMRTVMVMRSGVKLGWWFGSSQPCYFMF
jgi:hypothetical protein